METAYWVIFERQNKEAGAKPFVTREGALKWCNSTNHTIIAITTPINIRKCPYCNRYYNVEEWGCVY